MFVLKEGVEEPKVWKILQDYNILFMPGTFARIAFVAHIEYRTLYAAELCSYITDAS